MLDGAARVLALAAAKGDAATAGGYAADAIALLRRAAPRAATANPAWRRRWRDDADFRVRRAAR